MDEATKLELEQAARVRTAAGVLFYELSHPVSFGPEILVYERDQPRLRLRTEAGSAGALLAVELDGVEIGISAPINANGRSSLDTELHAFFAGLTPPLWPLPVRTPKVKFTVQRAKKATGTLAARRAAAAPPALKPAPSVPASAMAEDFTPFVGRSERVRSAKLDVPTKEA
jgi:hypothetical protein